MSRPIRMRIHPSLNKLRERLEEVRPVIEAQQRTPEGTELLRKSLVKMKRALNFIEERIEQWRLYMAGLEGDQRIEEEGIFENMINHERHITEWLEDARETIDEIEIILVNDVDDGSDTLSVELGAQVNVPRARGNRNEIVAPRLENRERAETPSVYYPKLPWPNFFGDTLSWPVFWQAFQTNMGEKPVPNAQKCTYLLLSLKGKAARAMRGYQPTAENYDLVVDALKRLFGNEKVIKEALQNELLNLPQANEAVVSLRSCLEDVERVVRQLNNLGYEGDKDFVMMTIKNKFPRAIILEALKAERNSGKDWNVEDLIRGLEEIVSLREEAMRCTKVLKPASIQRDWDNGQKHAHKLKENWQNNQPRNKRDERNPQRVFLAQDSRDKQSGRPSSLNPKCFLCEGPHWPTNCRQLINREARLKIIDEQKRCQRCLRKGHEKANCTGRMCFNCNGDHHKAICQRTSPRTGANRIEIRNPKPRWQPNMNQSSNLIATAMSNVKEVLLMSARANISLGPGRECISVLVFFDSGSQVSLITDKLIRKISPPKISNGTLDLLSIRSRTPTRINSPKYLVKLETTKGKMEELIVSRVDLVTKGIKRANINSGEMELMEEEPDILIGMAEFWRFFKNVEPFIGNLVKVQTVFGTIICGEMKGQENNISSFTAMGLVQKEEEPDKFWELEAIGVRDNPIEKDDEVALKMFKDTIHRNDGRYVVSWPWKGPKEELPTNYALAYRRMVNIIEKLKRSEKHLKEYDAIFKEQLKNGIVEETEIKGYNEHFLPHHCVIVAGKKPRVVYDASAKTRGNKCLNDLLFRGPIYMPELPGLLMRSRIPKIALWGDIQRAFWTLELQEEDRDTAKYLWVKEINKPISKANICAFRFKRVPFGVISSPFLLGATVKHHLKEKGTQLSKEVEGNTFVDNIFVGCKNTEETLEKYKELKKLFADARMNIREFISNSEIVNNRIPEEDRLVKDDQKILGVKWDIKKDLYRIKLPEINETKTVSRRLVLKGINSVFDPCGWLVPCLLPAKILFQSLWEEEKKWDDKLGEEQQNKWSEIQELWKDRSFEWERRVTHSNIMRAQLHVFVDASKYAYATCVYLKIEGDETKISLLYARSRLKPRKLNITIPRMELLGALIGVRAINYVEKELEIQIEKKFLWCDSKPVLFWIKSAVDQPRFVQNRLREIRKSQGLECRYVPTEENPADVGSRGCTPEELKSHPLWWKGPSWLKEQQCLWPEEISFKIEGETNEEVKPEVSMAVIKEVDGELIQFSKFKNWEKIVKVVARVMKMIKIWMRKTKKEPVSTKIRRMTEENFINPQDFELAEKETLKQGQNGWDKYTGNPPKIRTFTASDELIRLDSRIKNSETTTNFKFPLVFPKGSTILEVLVWRAHEKVRHGKVDATLNEFVCEFWAPNIRALIKKVIKRCNKCKRMSGPAFALPPMQNHPEERVRTSRPFESISLDYLGPSLVKSEGKTVKFWILLITCLTTRAVYLEPALDLSAYSFLQILRRFASRRGTPKRIMSDNAQTFRLAARVAGAYEARGGKGRDELEKYLVRNKIIWRFIPALSPWANSLSERLVKICKDAFKASLGRMVLQMEELRTFTAEVEWTMNCRPITHVSIEPEGERALRPIDFINPGIELGISLPNLEDEIKGDDEFNLEPGKLQNLLRTQWRKTNKVLEWFWNRWQKEYLAVLRNRTQWLHKGPKSQEKRDPKEGEVVLIEDEFHPRNTWQMGRIIKLGGNKGTIRSAQIQLAPKGKEKTGRIIERPVNKLYSLEVKDHQGNPPIKGSVDEINSEEFDQQKLTKEKNNHPMKTRSKTRREPTKSAEIMTAIMIIGLSILGMINSTNGEKARNNNSARRKCTDCKLNCGSHGIELTTPRRMKKFEICCMGKCFTHSYLKSYEIKLKKANRLIEHECLVTYWAKDKKIYKNNIICPPIEECQLINCWLCLERVANPYCSPPGTLIIMGTGLACILSIIICIFMTAAKLIINLWWIIKICFCGPYWTIRSLLRFRERKVGDDESEENLLKVFVKREKERSERRRNRRLYRLGSVILLSLPVLISILTKVEGGAEVVAVQANSEDCVRDTNGSICRIRGATQLTILPTGQKESLALKDASGKVAGSLDLTLKYLRLHCNQETLRWLRSYKVGVASKRRCPTMGSCTKGKCKHTRMKDKIPEMKEYESLPGNTFCNNGEAIWGHKCGLPTSECFFYRTFAEPTSEKVWELVRCTGWDYELKMELTLSMGNMTKKTKVTMFPGLTVKWEKFSFTPEAITAPIAPVLNDYFIVSKDEIIFGGKEIKTDLTCKGPEEAKNFSCKLKKDACKECWLNKEKGQMECACSDATFEEMTPKLPFTTAKLNLRRDGRKIISETEYSPVKLLVRVDALKLVTTTDGTKCDINIKSFRGCYNCGTGGSLTYECKTEYGQSEAEIRCNNGLIILAKCNETGHEQTDVLHFEKAEVNLICGVECPGGTTNFSLKGTLGYVPMNEKEFRMRNTEKLNEDETEWNWESLKTVDWEYLLKYSFNWKNSLIVITPLIIGAIILLIVVFLFQKFSPVLRGFRVISRNILIFFMLINLLPAGTVFLPSGGSQESDRIEMSNMTNTNSNDYKICGNKRPKIQSIKKIDSEPSANSDEENKEWFKRNAKRINIPFIAHSESKDQSPNINSQHKRRIKIRKGHNPNQTFFPTSPIKMAERKTPLITFAAELMQINNKEVPRILSLGSKKVRQLEAEMKDVEERGGKIWSAMNAKEGGPLQNWAVVIEKPERMDFGGVKSVKELNKQINQIEIPGWAIYGPGIVAHQKFFPIAGIEIEGILDIYDMFHEFIIGIEPKTEQKRVSFGKETSYETETETNETNENNERAVEFIIESVSNSVEFQAEGEFFREERNTLKQNETTRTDGRFALKVKGESDPRKGISIKGIIKWSIFILIHLICMATAMDNKRGLDESILDDFSDEETPPKRAKVAEGIMATIDCQPSTSREGNQTGTGKMENEIGALVQANPMFVSQLATVAGQLLGTVLREERTGTTKVWRGRGSAGRGGFTKRGGGTWGSPNFPQAKRESNDQRQPPHQLAATASETLHELAEHFRTSNPELAILLVALEAGMAELSYHAKTGHWCSR